MRFIRSGKASSATKSCGCGHMMEEETGGEEVLTVDARRVREDVRGP
jgi:hypothetical protein